MVEEERIIIKEYKECFGEYCDEDGNLCREGVNGFCNYEEECKKECIHY